MPRTITTGSSHLQTQQDADGGMGSALTNIGTATMNLGTTIATTRAANAKLRFKTLDIQSNTQQGLWDQQSKKRYNVFIDSTKNIVDESKRQEAFDAYNESEDEEFSKWVDESRLNEMAQNKVKSTSMLHTRENADVVGQHNVDVAIVEGAKSDGYLMIENYVNDGDAEGAQEVNQYMLDNELITRTDYNNIKSNIVPKVLNGEIALFIAENNNPKELSDYGIELTEKNNDGSYKNFTGISELDRSSKLVQLENKQVLIMTTVTMPENKRITQGVRDGTETLEGIATSNADEPTKILNSNILSNRGSGAWAKTMKRDDNELSKLVHKSMMGTKMFVPFTDIEGDVTLPTFGMRPVELNDIVDYVIENGTDPQVINEILDMYLDGIAGDNVANYLNISDSNRDVKYPSGLAQRMNEAVVEFNELTSDLPPRDRLIGFAQMYKTLYKGAEGAGIWRTYDVDTSNQELWDGLKNRSLQKIRESRVQRDLINNNYNSTGIAVTRGQQRGMDIQINSVIPDDVAHKMRTLKISEQAARELLGK